MDTAKKIGTAILSVLGAAMLVISIADMPAQFAVWSGWLKAVSPYLHTMTTRVVLACVGILIALAPWIVEWRKPVVKVQVKPINGPSKFAALTVCNKGPKRKFSVQCELLALRNSPNRLKHDYFTLKWADSSEKWLSLHSDESAKVLIASWEIIHKEQFASLEVLELSQGISSRVEWAGWNTISTENTPEYDLRITILGEGTRKPFISSYTLRPETWHGPLELIPLS